MFPFFYLLTPTNFHTPEGIAPGDDRGGVGGVGGGVPARNIFTARGWHILSPWNSTTHDYVICRINLGSNPISNLEVVSSLNILSQTTNMYHYYYGYCLQNYAPKLYLGTLQTTAQTWLYDNFNGTATDQIYTKNIWPKNYQQDSQKGEANTILIHISQWI